MTNKMYMKSSIYLIITFPDKVISALSFLFLHFVTKVMEAGTGFFEVEINQILVIKVWFTSILFNR